MWFRTVGMRAVAHAADHVRRPFAGAGGFTGCVFARGLRSLDGAKKNLSAATPTILRVGSHCALDDTLRTCLLPWATRPLQIHMSSKVTPRGREYLWHQTNPIRPPRAWSQPRLARPSRPRPSRSPSSLRSRPRPQPWASRRPRASSPRNLTARKFANSPGSAARCGALSPLRCTWPFFDAWRAGIEPRFH